MKQHEAVLRAMQESGGYSTLGQLYQRVIRIPDCHWGTKTPFASIRRIVQEHQELFFKIRPGLWALTSERKRILQSLSLTEDAPAEKFEEFNHSFYQGLIVEIGNLRSYETFVPSQDKNKLFLSKRLSEISTLQQLHPFTYDHILNRAKTVDVVWFNERRFPDSFFEIEHSTDMQNSLVKFSEFQDFRTNFLIVADVSRRREFEAKIAYSAFKPIQHAVKFLDYQTLSDMHSKFSALVAFQSVT